MILHCPACTEVVLRNLSLAAAGTATLSFDTRCPHCKHPIKVELHMEPAAVLIVNGVRREDSAQGGSARLL